MKRTAELSVCETLLGLGSETGKCLSDLLEQSVISKWAKSSKEYNHLSRKSGGCTDLVQFTAFLSCVNATGLLQTMFELLS